jgi:hypothetical protein
VDTPVKQGSLACHTWQQKSAHLRGQHGFAAHGDAGAHPWTSEAKLHGMPTSHRVKDLLDVGYLLARKKKPTKSKLELVTGLWADYSQSVHTRPFFDDGIGTLATSTTLYSYQFDCRVPGIWHLRILGWLLQFGRIGFSESEIRSLSGESVSLPVWSQMLFAYYCNPWAPWWQ